MQTTGGWWLPVADAKLLAVKACDGMIGPLNDDACVLAANVWQVPMPFSHTTTPVHMVTAQDRVVLHVQSHTLVNSARLSAASFLTAASTLWQPLRGLHPIYARQCKRLDEMKRCPMPVSNFYL